MSFNPLSALNKGQNQVFMVYKSMDKWVRQNFDALWDGASKASEHSSLMHESGCERILTLPTAGGETKISSSTGLSKVNGKSNYTNFPFEISLEEQDLIAVHDCIAVLIALHQKSRLISPTGQLAVWLEA